MDYRQLDGTSTTAATDSPMTDQQAPERLWLPYVCISSRIPAGYYVDTEKPVNHAAKYVRSDLLEAAEKERDQAIAREKALKSTYDENRKALVENTRKDLYDAAIKQRDELVAKVERLRCMNPNPGNQRYWEGRYRDEKADNERLAAERDQALASVGAVIEATKTALAMGDAGYRVDYNPDATSALNEMLADAWDEGWQHRNLHGLGPNPHRKDKQ